MTVNVNICHEILNRCPYPIKRYQAPTKESTLKLKSKDVLFTYLQVPHSSSYLIGKSKKDNMSYTDLLYLIISQAIETSLCC